MCGRHAPSIMRQDVYRLPAEEYKEPPLQQPQIQINTIRFYDTVINPFRVLSNYHEMQFLFEGNKWLTVEHAYQAMKFMYTSRDTELTNTLIQIVNLIARASTAFEAKAIGEANSGFIRGDWNATYNSAFSTGDRYMFKLIEAKLDQHKEIADILLNTGEDEIVSVGNDTYWGKDEDDNGQNVLGKFLIGHRNRLRSLNRVQLNPKGRI
jgi:N-glycosidase YbiA